MFSLYGLSGQDFRGTLEQMRELPGVTGARRSRPISRVGEETLHTFTLRVAERPSGAAGSYEAAAEAYKDMLRLEQERGPLYHAYQIMSRDVLTLATDDAAQSAWRTLAERGVRQAPVLDAARNLVGLCSERDLLTTFNLDGGQPRDALPRQVSDVMISPVVSADPVTDIRRVARVMLEFNLTGVPVVTETRALVGFVTRGDILRAVIADPPLSLWG